MKLNRRRFIKLAGSTAALALPTWITYDAASGWFGEAPPDGNPYVPVDLLKTWPSSPAKASPILLLVNNRGDNPFGAYLAEILHAEGLNCFEMAGLSDLANAPLSWYDLVLLSEGSLDSSQSAQLEDYVAQGGRLVAMRPEQHLAPLFGLEALAASTAEGYLRIDDSQPIAQGIPTTALQFHGMADHYRLTGAQALAWLGKDANDRSDSPAVTVYGHGQGQAALWAFDLARSVAYTRQGNPAWANQERDGGVGVRTVDMFKGWIDLDRIQLPQADYQQRLLANLLSALSQDARPLPRLWYFPGSADSIFIATGDGHSCPAFALEDMLARAERRGGCMSIYYTCQRSGNRQRAIRRTASRALELPLVGKTLSHQFTSPTASHIGDWRARGHEFGLHPYVEEGVEGAWGEI